MAKLKKTFLSRQLSIEDRVLRCVKKLSEEKQSINCVVEFMKICWQLPYYGLVILYCKFRLTEDLGREHF